MKDVIDFAEATLRRMKDNARRQAGEMQGFKDAIRLAEEERQSKLAAARAKFSEAGELAREAAQMLDAAERDHRDNLLAIEAEIDKIVSARVTASKPAMIAAAAE